MDTKTILLSTAMMCMLALPAAAQDAGGGAAPQPMPQTSDMGGMDGPGMVPGMAAPPTVDPQAVMGMMNAAGNMMGMVTIGFLTSADADHDGNITQAEWGKLFDKLDPNHDGTITKAELDTMKKEQADRMQQMRAEMMQHMQEMRKMQGMNAPATGAPVGNGMEEPPPSPHGAPAQ